VNYGRKEQHIPVISFVSDGYAVTSIELRLSGEAPFPAQIDTVIVCYQILSAATPPTSVIRQTRLSTTTSPDKSIVLSDDGTVTGRGTSMSRGFITGGATFLGGSFHALPFLISELHTALLVASFTVGCELIGIAWIRKRFLDVSLKSSLIQVTLGGVIVATAGVLIGQA